MHARGRFGLKFETTKQTPQIKEFGYWLSTNLNQPINKQKKIKAKGSFLRNIPKNETTFVFSAEPKDIVTVSFKKRRATSVGKRGLPASHLARLLTGEQALREVTRERHTK